jgi:hypothetical protein
LRATSRRFQASSIAGVTREHRAPSPPGDEPGQRRQPQPVGRLVADPAGLAAKHRILVPENQELGIL